MGSIDIPTFLRDKSKQSQTTEIEGNAIDVPDFLKKKEAEPTHLTSSATPSQSPSEGIIIPPPIIPKGEGINEPVSTQVVQPKITASYNDYIMHHEQRDAKREESKQKAVDKAAKNILKTKGIIKPGDENKALDVHQYSALTNEKSRLEESLKNKDALIAYKDGEPELIEKGEPNVGGYIWNKVTDAVGGMSNAAGDLVFQLMSKIPAIRGDATEEETMKLYREEMSPTIRTGVTKLLGSDVPKEREKDYNGQFLTSAVGSIASMIPPIASPKGIGFILQAFDGGLQSINSSEAGKNLPESQKTIFATGVGIATGLLMKVGVDKIFGKQTDKIASSLTANVMADLVKKSSKPITAEAFEVAMQTAVKNLKNKVIAAGGKIGESAIAGGLFGTAMEATTIAAEEITNKATGQQVFEPTTWGEKFGRVLHAGSEMATVGGLLGGIHIPFSKTRDYIKEKVGEAKTPEDIQALKDELISKVQEKGGSEESAQQINDLVDKYVEVYNKIPPEANNKSEIVDNIQERDDLAKTIDEKTQQLQVVDPAFHEPIIQEINAANGRVDEINKEIANKAQEPQKQEEQPQPEVIEPSTEVKSEEVPRDYEQKGLSHSDRQMRNSWLESEAIRATKEVFTNLESNDWLPNHVETTKELLNRIKDEKDEWENIKKKYSNTDFGEMQGIPPKNEKGEYIKNGKEYSEYVDREIMPNLDNNIKNISEYLKKIDKQSEPQPSTVKSEEVKPENVVGKIFRDEIDKRTFEVKGENSGILTLEDVDTGKILRKKKSDVIGKFKEVVDEVDNTVFKFEERLSTKDNSKTGEINFEYDGDTYTLSPHSDFAGFYGMGKKGEEFITFFHGKDAKSKKYTKIYDEILPKLTEWIKNKKEQEKSENKPIQQNEEVKSVKNSDGTITVQHGNGIIELRDEKHAESYSKKAGITLKFVDKLDVPKEEVKSEKQSVQHDNTLQSSIDKFDNVENYTIEDLVNDAEGIAETTGNKKISDAIEEYRNEQEENRKLKGRGDMETANDKIEKIIREESKSETTPEIKKLETERDTKIKGLIGQPDKTAEVEKIKSEYQTKIDEAKGVKSEATVNKNEIELVNKLTDEGDKEWGYLWRGNVVTQGNRGGIQSPHEMIANDVLSDIKSLIEDFNDLEGLSKADKKEWGSWNEVAEDLISKSLSTDNTLRHKYDEAKQKYDTDVISSDAHRIAKEVTSIIDFDKAVENLSKGTKEAVKKSIKEKSETKPTQIEKAKASEVPIEKEKASVTDEGTHKVSEPTEKGENKSIPTEIDGKKVQTTLKGFYKAYTVVHQDVRNTDKLNYPNHNAEDTKRLIQETGFTESVTVNGYPLTYEMDATTKKGQVLYLIPEKWVKDTPNGAAVRKGFKPHDTEVVTIEYDGQPIHEAYLNNAKKLSETKPTQTEKVKAAEPTEAKKDIGTKARELASKLESGEKSVLPSWMKAKLPPGTKLSGIDIDKAYANALRTFADIHDATKNFAKAIEEGFKHIKEWFKENNIDIDEAEMKANFENEVREKEAKRVEESEDKFRDKGILNRLHDSENIPDYIKKAFEEKGLKYKPETQKEAEIIGKAIVEKYGIEDAVVLAESNRFKGGVNSAIFGEALNRLYDAEQKAKTPEEKLNAAKLNAEISIRMDEWARGSGQDISYIQHFYKKSPLAIKLKEETKRRENFTEFAKKKEQSWKEFFDEMTKDPEFEKEFQTKVQEELKKERAEARKKRIDKVDKIFDDAINALRSGGATYSTFIPIPPKALASALEGMKKAYHAGEKVAKIIEDAISYITDEVGSGWDKEKFRKEWDERLGEHEGKAEIPADKREKMLERFRKKLKGLSENEKDEVIRKSFKKLVENGALEYEDFRKIIADTLGYGEMTPEQAKKIVSLVEDINKVDELATKLRESDRTERALKEFEIAEKKAEKSATELGKLVFNKPNIRQRFLSIMQLNTLTFASLVNNPIFNIINQAAVRLPRSIIMSGIDVGIRGVGKAFGKDIEMQNNIIAAQKEFYRKLAVGTKQSFQQFRTGLTNKDYFQKEVYTSQIHPVTSMKELWAFGKGKLKLNKEQVADKVLQATFGVSAEGTARILNIGDKPQRFASEGGQAATFAKNLGVQNIDYKLFMKFPKEEAYRAFKKQGLSDEVAMKKAEEVEQRIIKEGEESVFQEDNLLNDMINGAFEAAKKRGNFAYGFGQVVKTLNMPFLKIPLNAFWNVYNLVNPEVALLQSAIYAGKALKTRSALDIQQSKKWFAHAVTGMAWMGVTGALAKAGVVNPGNPDEATKKERQGEQNYEQQGSINMGKLQAYIEGKDPNSVKDGLLVDLKWWGAIGIMMGYQAHKLEKMTPEQKKNGVTLMEDLTMNLSESALDFADKGVFANSGSMVTALTKGDGIDSYLLNLINMGTNVVHPATFAQLSRAQLPYYSKIKADSFSKELRNSLLTRSSVLRSLNNEYPPSKVSIWGGTMDKKDNTIMRLFNISRSDDDNFAQPIYNDYKKTNDTRFFPPSVKPEIKVGETTIKLNAKEAEELEIFVGQSRKQLVAPYINDMAKFEGDEKRYSELSNDSKIAKLDILYDTGYESGKYKFLLVHPEYKPKELTPIEQDKKEDIKDANEELREAAKTKMKLNQ